jgi:predicted MFS family arabinose efflux permease
VVATAVKRRVVWTAFTVGVFGWGIGFYGPAIYLPALHQKHGWPIAVISVAITAHYLVSAILIAFMPAIWRRFGIGRVTLVGAVCAGAGAIAWASAALPWHLVPALLISGAGWAAMSGAALNAIVAPWFDQDRPKAISTAFNGASVGGLLFTPLWSALASAFGLASAALILGSATVLIVAPLVRLVLWQRPPPRPSADVRPPLPRAILLRQGRFLTLSIAFALGLFAQIGLFTHLPTRLVPVFGEKGAAVSISLITLCAIVGRSALAWILDDHDRRVAAGANLLLQAAGSVLLALGEGPTAIVAGGVLFGLGVGNLTTLPPLIAQREYCSADVGTVVALVVAVNQAVFAFAPAVLGWLRDLTDDYGSAFLLAAAAQLLGAVLIVVGRRFS